VETIKDIITGVIKGLETKKHAHDEPELLLRSALSKTELAHVRFRYLRKGIFGITVDSSVRLYQLNLRKQELLEKLCGKNKAIKEIRFYIGETE
jgi:hypothetical protein